MWIIGLSDLKIIILIGIGLLTSNLLYSVVKIPWKKERKNTPAGDKDDPQLIPYDPALTDDPVVARS